MPQTYAGRIKVRRSTASGDELQTIPGVGPSIAHDLRDLGIRRVADLRGKDPQLLYERIEARRGVHQDRCLLYVFRCAVYFASTPRPDPRKLLWWSWKDAKPKRATALPRSARRRSGP